MVTSRHTIEVDFQEGGTLAILGRPYSLTEFHFHEPSEHQLNGLTYPMEAHLVHRDSTGHLVALEVLMNLGTEPASWAALWDRIPNGKQDDARDLLVSPQELLPQRLASLRLRRVTHDASLYQGRPLVLKTPIAITVSHLERFTALIGHNVRPVQPLNEREIDEE